LGAVFLFWGVADWVVVGVVVDKLNAAPNLIPVDVASELRALLELYPLAESIEDADFNQGEMAAALGTSIPTISKWIKNEGMPVAQEGGLGKEYVLRLSHCYAWKEARDRQETVKRSHNAAQISAMQARFLSMDIENPLAQLSAKDRAALADADFKHSRAMQMRRQLVPLDDLVDLLESLFVTVRNKMEGLPDILERELALGPDEVEKVQRIGNDLLTEMADQIKQAELTEKDIADVEVQKQLLI
jgi:phage terminase Nu1 subunit (DNA packaging protein)